MVKFETMNTLKKWVISNKYFIKVSDPKEKKIGSTHFLLDGGIWKIPKGEYLEFLRILSIDLQNNEKHYISENRTEVFKFICDLDFYEDSEISILQLVKVIDILQDVISTYFGQSQVIICGSDSKTLIRDSVEIVKSGFHLVWPKVWVTNDTAKKLRITFIEKLIQAFGERPTLNTWSDVVDLAVYEDNGLRMIGCRKMSPCKVCKNKKDLRDHCETCESTGKVDEGRVYSPKMILPENESYLATLKKDYYLTLLETSIYNYADFEATKLIKEIPVTLSKSSARKTMKKDERDGLTVKIENFIRKNFKDSHPKVTIKKLTSEPEKYYAEPDDNFCINVNRNHTSSGVYFQITPSGVCQRCFCKKDTMEGRLQGPCKMFSSKVVSLTKPLQTLLFGVIPGTNKKGKKINAFNLSRNSSTGTLDLSLTPNGNKTVYSNREICLENCKNILFQLEKELLN